jgi:hypothetical protein
VTARADNKAIQDLRGLPLVGPPPRTHERGAEASYMQRSNNRQLLRHRGSERC